MVIDSTIKCSKKYENDVLNVHNVRLVKYILYTRLKVKKLKYSNQTFLAVCHHHHHIQTKRFWLFAIIRANDDGKQPKTFGLNILIF